MTLVLSSTPITPETFVLRASRTSTDGHGATDAMIGAAQTRLDIRLPRTLADIYRRHDGGYVGRLWVPLLEGPVDKRHWRAVMAPGYHHLRPLRALTTLREATLIWADAEEDADLIPEQAHRYIVLAQRYEDTTFLDYSEPGPPRLSVVDFEHRKPSVHFDSFSAFLGAVRREPDRS